jgi:hypothetical protein
MPEILPPQPEQPRANYTCPECSRAFRTAQGLSGHKQLAHRGPIRNRDPPPAETRVASPEVPESAKEPAIKLEPAPAIPRPRARAPPRYHYQTEAEAEPLWTRKRRVGFHFGIFHI